MANQKKSPNLLFINRLMALLSMRHITQSELAAGIGISKQRVSNYMTGDAVPDINILLAIAKYLNVSCDALLDEDNLDIAHELLEKLR